MTKHKSSLNITDGDGGKLDLKTMMETGVGFSGFSVPDACGDFDFVIKKDGTWLYQGTPIGRKKLIQLFATVLQKENDEYWLITPAEKGRIVVEDAPFVMEELSVENAGTDEQVIKLRSSLDWWVVAGVDEDTGLDNKIWVEIDECTGQPNPYIMVRDNLHARINRNSFYALCDLAFEQKNDNGTVEMIVKSNGTVFSLGQL